MLQMKCVGDNLKTDTILQKTVLGHFEYSKKIPQKLKNEEDFYRRKALKKDPPV